MAEEMNNNEQRGARRSDMPTAKTAASDRSGASISAAGGVGVVGDEKKKHTKLFVIIAILVVLAIAAIGFGVWWFGAGGSDFYDASAASGQAPYKTEEEIQAELNRIVEEGMLNISIASVIEFEDGASPGVAYIENVPSNKYVMRVTITLDENGEIVYQSGGIRPDSYIETITLNQDLDAGSYPATATFTAYDPDSLEEVGQAAAKVTLSIAN